MARASLAKQTVESEALLVRRVALRESDVIVELFCEQLGAISALARGARRSQRRFAGLEPMHQLRARFELTPGRELAHLVEITLLRPRLGLTSRLEALEAAGRALRWLRQVTTPRSPEPALWRAITTLLDALDAGGEAVPLVASAGLRFLAEAGWALELGRCVRCGRPCPPAARTTIDVRAGGVVCRACGGFGSTTSASQRAALEAAMTGAGVGEPFAGDAAAAIVLVDAALAAHARGEGT